MSRFCLSLIAVTVLAGAALRVAGMGTRAFHHDEPATILFATGAMDDNTAIRAAFLVPAITRGGIALFGPTEFGVRLPFVLAGVISLALVASVGWRLGGPPAGFFAAALQAALAAAAPAPFRFLGWLLPLVLPAAALPAVEVARRFAAGSRAAVLAVAVALVAVHGPQVAAYAKNDGYSRGAAECLEYVRGRWRPGDLLVVSGRDRWLAAVYAPGLAADTRTAGTLTEADIEGRERVWLVHCTIATPGMEAAPRRFPAARVEYVVAGATPLEPFAMMVLVADGPP